MFRDRKISQNDFCSLLYPSHVLKASEGTVSDSEDISRQLLIIPHYFIVCSFFWYYQAAELKHFFSLPIFQSIPAQHTPRKGSQ